MNELSKVKRDLEVALKDVLQAMRANDGTSTLSLDNLAHVGAEARSNCPIIVGGGFSNPADVLISDVTDYRCYKPKVSV